jgi:hypothetical protein
MEPEKKSNGAFVGVVIIILVLIIGGIYIWQSKVQKALEVKKAQEENVVPADTTQNELDALEKDLNSLDTDVSVDVNAIN